MAWKKITNRKEKTEEKKYHKEKDRTEMCTITSAALEQYLLRMVMELNMRLIENGECGMGRILWVEDIILTGYETPARTGGSQGPGMPDRAGQAAEFMKNWLVRLWKKVRSLRP